MSPGQAAERDRDSNNNWKVRLRTNDVPGHLNSHSASSSSEVPRAYVEAEEVFTCHLFHGDRISNDFADQLFTELLRQHVGN